MSMRDGHPSLRLAAGGTIVAFARQADRWRHVISSQGEPILESVEGGLSPDDDPRWPASPALTEVSAATAGGQPVILGVGRAGRSHFSVSVTVHPERADTLLFDVACRIQEAPPRLGSTYQTAHGNFVRTGPPAAEGDLPRTVQWAYAVGPAGLVPEPVAARQRSP
jgi:hypothetical protein